MWNLFYRRGNGRDFVIADTRKDPEAETEEQQLSLDHIEDSIGDQLRQLLSTVPKSTVPSENKSETEKMGKKKSKSTSLTTIKKKPREPEERVHPDMDAEPVEPDPVEPPKDKDGEPLSVSEIHEALGELALQKLHVDTDARRTAKNPEQQANRVKNLMKTYKATEEELQTKLKKAREYEATRRGQEEYRDYGLTSEGDNASITALVDESIADFFAQVDDLKDIVADRLREGLDKIEDPHVNSQELREEIYEELVGRGVIESWEPMEF